ncbi:MAG TPA: membrane dipeptidase [Planctomycetota bacterium]|nr:membrane dipeptidase [Planctomycetota bacterium]
MAGGVTRRRTLLLVLLVPLLALAVAPLWLPGVVERTYNPVHPPAAPVAVSDADRALHARLLVADLHADSLLWDRDLLARGTRGHADLPRLLEGNVALQVFSAVTQAPAGGDSGRGQEDLDRVTPLIVAELWPARTWGSRLQRAMYQAFLLQQVEARSEGAFVVIHSAAGLQHYLERRAAGGAVAPRLAGVLALEGAQALEGSLTNLELLHAAGYRVLGLAHLTDNEVAGSVHGRTQGGLTPFGRLVVARAEELGMLIDVAHSSPATIDDVLALARGPVIASHTGVRGTADNPRNLSDAQLDGIAKSGGLVGIGFWEVAVGGEDPRDIVRAIRYAADRIGTAHVALGSDFDGSVATPFDASGLVQLTALLRADRFTDDDIAAIMGGNVLSLLAATLPPR